MLEQFYNVIVGKSFDIIRSQTRTCLGIAGSLSPLSGYLAITAITPGLMERAIYPVVIKSVHNLKSLSAIYQPKPAFLIKSIIFDVGSSLSDYVTI